MLSLALQGAGSYVCMRVRNFRCVSSASAARATMKYIAAAAASAEPQCHSSIAHPSLMERIYLACLYCH